MNRKIKIFLGAYINFPNAQNINCEAIARYLDKDKFNVHTMYSDKMPIDKDYYHNYGIHLHRLIHHRFVWFWCKFFTMLFGNYDVYYLPKKESVDRLFAKLLKGKRVFVSSIEGVVTLTTNNFFDYRNYYESLMDYSFAISGCIADSVKKNWNWIIPVLPLGVNEIVGKRGISDGVKNIIWVGNIKANKRPMYLVKCALMFPNIHFTMIGDGDMMDEVRKAIKQDSLNNLTLLGRIPNSEVYSNMMKNDLLLMTSEYEGLPKVIQEAAQCAVPCIYIGENYTVDFIEEGNNGYKVENLNDMIEKIKILIENPSVYKVLAKNAVESIQPFLWSNLIKKYEDYFESVVSQ